MGRYRQSLRARSRGSGAHAHKSRVLLRRHSKHTQQQTPSFLIGPCFELGIRRPYYGDAQRTLCGPNPRDLSAEAVTHATRRFRPAAPPLRVAAAPAATPPASLATLAISTSFYYLLGIRPLVPRLLLSLPEATRLLKRARLRLADRR